MKIRGAFTVFIAILILLPIWAFAAGSSNGNGSGGEGQDSGSGDLFGDLIHMKRDAVSGQPILQKRWIEYPQDILDWGYCPIPITETGDEISFADLSCEPLDDTLAIEVDYFGRLSASRTKERNMRMHFNEVISNIKNSERVRQDKAGRLEFGVDCAPNQNGAIRCETWSTIDSPMENLALYSRLMKYGHIQTDPMEIDTFAHGDPAAGIPYHPALAADDWGKFVSGLRHLLPGGANGVTSDCFTDVFNQQCSMPETLRNRDFVRSASFLGGASGKEGKITVDLVQYLNRFLKITQDTDISAANPTTLPALIRDCGDDPLNQSDCNIIDAEEGLPSPADERFVDFRKTRYLREAWRDKRLNVLMPLGSDLWLENRDVELLGWLEFINGEVGSDPILNINGFVAAASDGLRTVQFIHNYEIPEDLGWDFQ